uniref:Uncharacterized protein n=1 Tax=Timema poppense TaxID=170557 RepID=A0A7R9HA63_TIMPO|nr:unnamed protein product [Timema poppensis]
MAFIACWLSSELSYQSERVAVSVYESNWLEASLSLKTSLIIIIRRSQKPVTLSMAKCGSVNLKTFVSVGEMRVTEDQTTEGDGRCDLEGIILRDTVRRDVGRSDMHPSQPNLTRSDSTTIHTGDTRHHNIHARLNRGSYLIAGRVIGLPPTSPPKWTTSLGASFCRIADKRLPWTIFLTSKLRPLVLEIILE